MRANTIVMAMLLLGSLACAVDTPVSAPPLPPGVCEFCDRDRSTTAPNLVSTPLLSPAERPRLSLDHILTRHDGTDLRLSDAIGRPLAIAFVYTRCANQLKCPLAASTMERLRQRVVATGLEAQVRLFLVTFDPEYDTPEVMTAYARERGLVLGAGLGFLRPRPEEKEGFFAALRVPISFAQDGVAIHGVHLLLVDRLGRLAREHRIVVWDNDTVLGDLTALARE